MLEQPDLHHDLILARLRESYALAITHLEFLPLGADANTAVYCAIAADGTRYFVKLRRGGFDKSGLSLLKQLKDRGVEAVIAPIIAGDGQLWTEIAPYSLVLFPFIEGRNGYEIELTADHWRELGATLMRVHTIEISPALADSIRREDFAPRWREAVRGFLADIRRQTYADPVAAELATFLSLKQDEVLHLVEQAERLAATLRARPQEFVLCHSDLHAGNVLIDGDGKLYIVDWDQPIFAPIERDLMYPGGAQGFRGFLPEEEETLFYRGYGLVEVDPVALAYYRCERIVEDIAVYCDELLLSDAGGTDREQSLRYVMSNFEPGGTIEAAYRVLLP